MAVRVSTNDLHGIQLVNDFDATSPRTNGILTAAAAGEFGVLRTYLLDPVDIDTRDDRGRTPLMLAAQNGHSEIVGLLLDLGADADARDDSGAIALGWAVAGGHVGVVQLLMARAPEMTDSRDNNGLTALMWAAAAGHLDLATMLILQCASVDMRDLNGVTALTWAASRGHLAIVRILIDAGASIDLADNSGATALIWASAGDHHYTVRALIDSGARVSTKDLNFATALEWASEKRHMRTVEVLLANGAEDSLISAASRGDIRVVDRLLAQELPMMKLDFLVTGAARSGTVYMARLLSGLGIMCGHEAIFGHRGLPYAVHMLRTRESETSYVSRYDVRTEQPLEPWFRRDLQRAESSNMAAPFIDHPMLDGTAVIHVVRNPLSVLSSLVTDMHFFRDGPGKFDPFREFVVAHIGDPMHLPTEIERACLYWVEWNEMIERKARGKSYLLFRVDSSPLGELNAFLKLPVIIEEQAFVDKRSNSWKFRTADLSVADIPEGDIKDRFERLCRRLGYGDTTGRY